MKHMFIIVNEVIINISFTLITMVLSANDLTLWNGTVSIDLAY